MSARSWQTAPKRDVIAMWWRVLAGIYKIIRPAFVSRVDPNEDYACMHCGRPVLRRFLFCSNLCAKADGSEW